MSIALRQSQMDIFDFISLFSGQKPRSYSTRRILRQAGTVRALEAAASALRINGILISWLPTALQVFELVRSLQTSHQWARVRSSETLLRPWRVGPRSILPAQRMVGHTGFLISARRIERIEIMNV